jgi:hypothetical protein
VNLLAAETVTRSEPVDLALDLALLSLEAGELGLAVRQGAQVLGDESADRAATFGCPEL